MISLFALYAVASPTPPPKVSYDKAKDETTYSTGPVRVTMMSGYLANYIFKGKDLTHLGTSTIVLFNAHINSTDQPEHDSEGFVWADQKTITITLGGVKTDYPATYGTHVDNDKARRALIGRIVAEDLTIIVPTELLTKISNDDTTIEAGKWHATLNAKSRKSLVSLVASLD